MATMNVTIIGQEFEVEFDYNPAERETGPSYACGGTPGSPAYIELVAVRDSKGNDILDELEEIFVDKNTHKCPPTFESYADYLQTYIEEHYDDKTGPEWEPDPEEYNGQE